MKNKVTIQDIADALGLSRNTVSKAINNTGVLADSTREKVLQKAVEMGYKQFSYSNIESITASRLNRSELPARNEIALFTTGFLGSSHFASPMLDNFQKEISPLGYSLSMHRVHEDDIKNMKLPITFSPDRTSGIMCIEMFHAEYNNMLCNLDIPILFVDGPAIPYDTPKSDLLLMDNESNIYAFVKEMNDRGYKKFGFIGEPHHCRSFFERFMAVRNSMYLLNLTCNEEYFIIGNKNTPSTTAKDYQEYLLGKIQALEELPDVFVCANDFVALDALQTLKALQLSVPDDVMLCGFDDSPESRVVTPALTTIHIHSQIMGLSAVQLLISRINEPSLNYRSVYAETDLIFRESTRD